MDSTGLLQALPFPDQPCGDDLSFSAAFDQIQEARRFDDPTLAQGEWVTEVKEADWRGVIRLCEALLATQTKDLRVVGWLTEALGRAHGLAGLADGHALTAALCDAFWDDIHPQAEDGELEQRIGALDWLLAQTTRLLRDVPLTASAKGRYSLADLEAARANARNPGNDDSARPSLDGFDAALTDPPDARDPFKGLGKVAALGIKVSRHCTYHGVALNIAMDLEPFERINPCGYAGLRTVDLSTIGVQTTWEEAAQVLGQHIGTLNPYALGLGGLCLGGLFLWPRLFMPPHQAQ